MSTLTVKELAAPTGFDLKIASGETLDLKSQGTVTMPTGGIIQVVNGNTSTAVVSTATHPKGLTAVAVTMNIVPLTSTFSLR